MRNLKISLITLLLAGFLAACSNGTTITGNPPENPLPSQPVGVDGGDDNGGDVAIDKAAFTKAAIEANALWKDEASEEGTAEYFVEFPRDGEVNIYPTDDREYLSFKYIIRLDGSVVAKADDKEISMIGSLNEEITALNMWLISKDGDVVATLTSKISDKDKEYFDTFKAFLSFAAKAETKAEEAMETVVKVAPYGNSPITGFNKDLFKHLKNLKNVRPTNLKIEPLKNLF